MKWRNLRDGICPMCSHPLIEDTPFMLHCDNCRFKIRTERLREILQKHNLNSSDEDNLLALNNLGHEKVEEDFSNSPVLDY